MRNSTFSHSSSSDHFEPALSLSSSTGSINPQSNSYSYFSKQQELLKYIQDSHSLLSSICSDHRNDRFPLLYPKFINPSQCQHIQQQQISTLQTKENKSRSRSRSLSIGTDKSRFQLIGLAGTRTSVPTCSSMSGSVATDLSVLEESSLGKLLLGRLEECRDYLERMAVRIKDRSSRVLVTGDVNGGKSTLINAFLQIRPPILPMDQQPCTQAFCEVVPAAPSANLHIHAIPDYNKYEEGDSNSYDSMSLPRMQSNIQEEDTPYQWYRIFLPIMSNAHCTLLSNELVHASLIDSPGLNSDLFKTMNLFARQEEIDVIVFVVNAANHLTLSAREFLETAGRDKAYIFIVVNKFDDIRNKEKCRRIILQQIADVLPSTAAESHELVHFISAKSEIEKSEAGSSADFIQTTRIDTADNGREKGCEQEFGRLQTCLTDFILSKRTKSKLLPAKTYLLNLLSDLQVLLEHNEQCCQEELVAVRRDIDVLAPCFEELVKRETPLRQDLLHGVTDASNQIYSTSSQILSAFDHNIKEVVAREPWNGVFSVWAWRRRIIERVEREAAVCVSKAQNSAKDTMKTSLEYLHFTSMSHAASVFAAPAKDHYSLSVSFDAISADTGAIKLSNYDLFDLSSLYSFGTCLRAVLAGGAAVGSALLVSGTSVMSSGLLNVLLVRQYIACEPRFKLLTVSIVALFSLSSVLLVSGDFEGMARAKLIKLLQAQYNQGDNSTWRHRYCQAIEMVCHQQLMTISGGLLQRFQEALATQRRLRAEKDLQRAQLNARLEQIMGNHRRICGLWTSVNSLQL